MTEHDEHIAVPPKTDGIAQQPTSEELSEIARAYSTQNSSKPLASIFVIAGALLVLVGLFAVFWFMNADQKLEIDVPQEVVSEASPEPVEASDVDMSNISLLDHIFAGTFKEELEGHIVTYSFDTQWKDRGLDFTMQFVHDLGVISMQEYVLPPAYVGKKIVVVELRVRDTRLTGEPISIAANKYVATRFEQTDTIASDWREVFIVPGEEKTVFVPFVLERTTQEYFILSGDLRNPFVSPIASSVILDTNAAIELRE